MGTRDGILWPETGWNIGELYWILGLQGKKNKKRRSSV